MSDLTQRYYLQQMGIETWIVRSGPGIKNSESVMMVVGIGVDEYRLFNKMVASIGLSDVNLYKMDGFNHDELTKQLRAVKPSLIFAAGCNAGQFLLNETQSLDLMRATPHDYQGVPVIVSYHPNDLLRNPLDKRKTYQDLLCAQVILGSHGKKEAT